MDIKVALLILAILSITGCIGGQKIIVDLPANATAKDIVPDSIQSYEAINTNELMSKAAAAAVTAGFSATDAGLVYSGGAGQFTDKFIQCYQKAGAVDSSGFYRTANPLYGGIIVAVDRNQITSPDLLFRCIRKGVPLEVVQGEEFQPCFGSLTIKTNYNEFYVVYMATSNSVCTTFCENIPGCSS